MVFTDSDLMIYLIAGGITAIIAFVVILAVLSIRGNSSKVTYDEQLRDLLSDDQEAFQTKITPITRWNNYWGKLFKEAGFARYDTENSTAGRDVLLIGFILATVVAVIFQNFIVGPIIAAVLIGVTAALMRFRSARKADDVNDQLPGFLFALSANIQAGETPERAMLKVVDNMPSPLYDDLILVKNRILANSTFKDALQELSQKTASRDLKFLCACMIQAQASGTNLEDQIKTIQKVLEARRKLSDELNKAVRSAMPAIWVSSVVIPVAFLFTYFADPAAQAFWFVDPISWIAIGAVVVLYAVGVFLSKKLIDSIRNL
jgi:tight adherence protein B